MPRSLVLAIVFFMVLINSTPSLYAEIKNNKKQEPIYNLIKDAETLYEEGAYDESENKCKKIIEMNENCIPAYNILGMIYSRKDGYENVAISHFEKSLSIDPMQADVYNQIAFLYNKLGRIDDAIVCMKKGLDRSPLNFQLNFNLGVIYLMQKNDAYKAIEYLKKAQTQNEKNERLAFLLGLASLSIGDKAKALESVTRLRELRDEYLASLLENCLRSLSPGGNVDVGSAMEGYANRPKKEVTGETSSTKTSAGAYTTSSNTPSSSATLVSQKGGSANPAPETKQKTKRKGLSIGPGTSSVVKGTGTVSMETTMKSKPDAITNGSNFENPDATY